MKTKGDDRLSRRERFLPLVLTGGIVLADQLAKWVVARTLPYVAPGFTTETVARAVSALLKVMPEGLEKDISPEQMRDLLSYLLEALVSPTD